MGAPGVEQKPWTDEDIRVLRKLWPDNSASVIGALLGKSRNAVIGKAGRLKLPAKGKPTTVAKRGTAGRSKSTLKRSESLQRAQGLTNRRPVQPVDKGTGTIHRASIPPVSVILSATDEALSLLAARGFEESAALIQVRRILPAADAGAGDVAPTFPPAPVPFSEATGCQWHMDMSTFLETGEHMNMLCCNAPRFRGRYCEFHWHRQQINWSDVPLQRPFE